MDDTFVAAADKLREQVQKKVDEIKAEPVMADVLKMVNALNALEDLVGRARTTLAEVFALEGAAQAGVTIGPDDFVNFTALDAAKAYLRRVGKPAKTFAEIVAGIRAGGGVVNQEDRLKTQLARSNEVKKVGENRFGLLEWYPVRKGRPPGSTAKTRDVGAEGGGVEDDGDLTAPDDGEVTAMNDTEDGEGGE